MRFLFSFVLGFTTVAASAAVYEDVTVHQAFDVSSVKIVPTYAGVFHRRNFDHVDDENSETYTYKGEDPKIKGYTIHANRRNGLITDFYEVSPLHQRGVRGMFDGSGNLSSLTRCRFYKLEALNGLIPYESNVCRTVDQSLCNFLRDKVAKNHREFTAKAETAKQCSAMLLDLRDLQREFDGEVGSAYTKLAEANDKFIYSQFYKNRSKALPGYKGRSRDRLLTSDRYDVSKVVHSYDELAEHLTMCHNAGLNVKKRNSNTSTPATSKSVNSER